MPQLPTDTTPSTHGTANRSGSHYDACSHFLACITDKSLSNEPFSHLYLTSVLPTRYYQHLLQQLPDTTCYQPARGWQHTQEAIKVLLDVESHKHELWIPHLWESTDNTVPHINPAIVDFWRGFYGNFSSPRVLQALTDLCGIAFGHECGNTCRMSLRLVREEHAAFVQPHLDRPTKLLSIIFYLAEEEHMSTEGTTLFGAESTMLTHPYTPKTALIVPRVDKSVHGVKPHRLEAARNTLQFYLIKD